MKSKSPSDLTRSMRRRIQKASVRCDRSQRWLQVSEKLYELSKDLKNSDEAGILKAINKLAHQIRMEAVKSPIQVAIKAIHIHGCSNIQEISEQTLLPVTTVETVIAELQRQGVVRLEPVQKTGPKTYRIILKKTPFELCDGNTKTEESGMPLQGSLPHATHLSR